MSDEIRYLLCTGEIVPYGKLFEYPKSQIIGQVTKVVSYKRKVTALKRWSASPRADHVPPVSPIIDSIVDEAKGMRCFYPGCQIKQDWYMGRDVAIALFVDRYGFSEEALNAVTEEDGRALSMNQAKRQI